MRTLSITAVLLTALFMVGLVAFDGNAQGFGKAGSAFVDADGDGINDNAPDADGDGIPNGQDPDYVRPLNGTGQKRGNMDVKGNGRGFVDADGDGINDLALDADGDGIPNCQDEDYVPVNGGNAKARRSGRSARNDVAGDVSLAPTRDRLQDGSCGTGTCDGTGIGKKIRRMGR